MFIFIKIDVFKCSKKKEFVSEFSMWSWIKSSEVIFSRVSRTSCFQNYNANLL